MLLPFSCCDFDSSQLPMKHILRMLSVHKNMLILWRYGLTNSWQSVVEPSLRMQNMQTDIANHVALCVLYWIFKEEAKPQKMQKLICNSKDLNECMTRKMMRGIKWKLLIALHRCLLRSLILSFSSGEWKKFAQFFVEG